MELTETREGDREKLNKEAASIWFSILNLVNNTCSFGVSLLVPYLYESLGLKRLGIVNIWVIYSSMFLSFFFSRTFLDWFPEPRNGLFVSALLNGLDMLALTVTCIAQYTKCAGWYCSSLSLIVLNVTSHFIFGFIGSTLMNLAQYEFVQKLGSNNDERKGFFATFYSFRQFSVLFANIGNLLLYRYQIHSLYSFIGYLILFALSTSGFLCLPKLDKPEATEMKAVPIKKTEDQNLRAGETIHSYQNERSQENQNLLEQAPKQNEPSNIVHKHLSAKESVQLFFKLLTKEPRVRRVLPYAIQSGASLQSYAAAVIYKYVVQAYANEPFRANDRMFMMEMISFILMFQSLSAVGTSQFIKKLVSKDYTWAMRISSIVLTSMLVSEVVFPFVTRNMYTIAIISIIYGFSFVCFNQLLTIYFSEEFPADIEAIAIYKQCQNLSCMAFLVIYLVLDRNVFEITVGVAHVLLTIWLFLA